LKAQLRLIPRPKQLTAPTSSSRRSGSNGSRSAASVACSILKPEFTMKTYVASIGGKAVLAFRAEDDDQARTIIDNDEGSMRSDLKVLVGTDGKPLWDGKSAIEAREATAAQHAESSN
jgi:hypothetical protein